MTMATKLKMPLFALGLALAFGPVSARAADDVLPPLPNCASGSTAEEDKDMQVVDEALQAFGKQGYSGVEPRLESLRAVLSRAPRHMNRLEVCGGAVIAHAHSQGEYLVLVALLEKKRAPVDSQRPIVWKQSPYPLAALVLGSYAVERGRYDEAIEVMRKGLAVDPSHPQLVSETAHALVVSKRPQESLALIDAALRDDPGIDDEIKAHLLRGRGFALGELNRFDEAEEAYRASLKLQPNNPIALKELDYIAQRRRGATAGEVTSAHSDGTPVKH